MFLFNSCQLDFRFSCGGRKGRYNNNLVNIRIVRDYSQICYYIHSLIEQIFIVKHFARHLDGAGHAWSGNFPESHVQIEWNRTLRNKCLALAGVAQWLDIILQTEESWVHFPVRTHAHIASLVPSWDACKGQLMFLPISFSLPAPLSRINKKGNNCLRRCYGEILSKDNELGGDSEWTSEWACMCKALWEGDNWAETWKMR